VLVAESSVAALTIAERHEGALHLLLTDVVMPRLSGPELATRVEAARPEVKVLCMSGYTDDMLGRHGVGASGYALIEKPFQGDTLARKVREVLGRRPLL
jgi:DNA-binding NtrC family response regulator